MTDDTEIPGWGGSAPPLPRTIGATLDATLSRQSQAVLWAATLLMVVAVAAADNLTGIEINISLFYLVPVIFSTWFISRRAGLAVSVASALAWALLDNFGGLRYSSILIPWWNALVRLASFVIVMQLVHIMRDSRAREATLARVDSLTGVANGRSFSDRARIELASARRTGVPLTLAYMDLDDFKAVNDTVGHTEGDRLLRVVAEALGGRLRETDLVARLGGDEFGVLLPGTDDASAPAVLESLRASVREAVSGSWDVDCTIGAVTFEKAPESVDFMVRAADKLMYRGKDAGRGRVVHAVWPERPEKRAEPEEPTIL